MPAVGKEIERPIIQEVDKAPIEQADYVEKVEKQVETQQQTNLQPQQPQTTKQPASGDMGKIVSAQFAIQTKPSIILPMNEKEVSDGLHHKVWEGVRWAAEWCAMMIKKYPGRVFYLPSETR